MGSGWARSLGAADLVMDLVGEQVELEAVSRVDSAVAEPDRAPSALRRVRAQVVSPDVV